MIIITLELKLILNYVDQINIIWFYKKFKFFNEIWNWNICIYFYWYFFIL